MLQAYQKEKNELQKKGEKRWKEPKRWEKRIRERATEKINVDTTILPQLNQKIVLEKKIGKFKKVIETTIQKSATWRHT